MPEQLFCQKCRRTMSDVKFYTYKDGSKCELCKNCLTMFMNMYEEDTYLWALEKFDVPYLPTEWQKTRQKEFDKAFTKVAASGAALMPYPCFREQTATVACLEDTDREIDVLTKTHVRKAIQLEINIPADAHVE